MSAAIKKKYRDAGLKPPKGRGIHSEAFHTMAIAIKKENPSYSMSRCYAIAMSKLGRNRAVKKGHRRPQSELRKVVG